MTDLIRDIVINIGLSATDAQWLILTAPKRYKQYNIPKRSGGLRLIAQPSRELKVLQRFLMERYLTDLPIHPSAMAYVVGRNIVDNATIHRKSSVLLKLDFENFFPSIKVEDWLHYVRKYKPEWSKIDILNISRILFWGQGSATPRCLSIGAPTSPLISNLLMFELDTLFYNFASKHGFKYTRYADDITLSANSIDEVLAFEKYVRQTLGKTKSPKLSINEEKRGLYASGQRRMVTGLVITPERKISIGRERKRLISALIHKYSLNLLINDKIGYLKGMLGFAIANEVSFVDSMRKKYGDSIIDEILKFEIPKKELQITKSKKR